MSMTFSNITLLAICFSICAQVSLTMRTNSVMEQDSEIRDEPLSYLVNLYNTVSQRQQQPGKHASLLLEDNKAFANTAHCINAERVEPRCSHRGDVRFNLTSMRLGEKVVAEKLVFRVPDKTGCNMTVKVYSSPDKSEMLREGTIAFTIEDRPRWAEFKVCTTPRVDNSWEMFELYIEFSTEGDEEEMPTIEELHPMLVVYTQNNQTLPRSRSSSGDGFSAVKRQAQPSYRELASQPCQRHQRFITYENLGWPDLTEFEVYVPLQGLQFTFCYGQCQSVRNLPTSTHARILELVNRLKQRVTPPPCCAPKLLLPVHIIYRNRAPNASPALKVEDNMFVDSCACF